MGSFENTTLDSIQVIHHKSLIQYMSRTYTSVSDNVQNLRNPPDIFPTSLGKQRERPVWIGPPRMMCVKGLNNHLPNQEVRP
jgi:hypothetical protein